ncbi:hypothetical protein [Dyadobacter sp. CY326]|uniref:hypothetical protein n=1 Tax=Dyadobacter sp. CY326 TaxID=2907300 RepID=UPI001F2B2556|nr:hypothetical protein [Dyadobacter sp. CY326]MCE7066721.1 hypothetical protein [Dyadobacter sp. CY326]
MKPSNILVICLLTMIFLAILGSNLVLKAEFDKLNKKDPLAGYKKEVVKPFKYVRLQGKPFGVTEIRQGATSEIDLISDPKYLSWEVKQDTLIVTYKKDWSEAWSRREDLLNSVASVYIFTPQLLRVDSDNAFCRIKGWKSEALTINQKGSLFVLADNKIAHVDLKLTSGNYAKIASDNVFGDIKLEVADSSSIIVEKDVMKTISANIDSSAQVTMPGSLLKKL